jgi:hypothetical protein
VNNAELNRRRQILSRHVGQRLLIKRQFLPKQIRQWGEPIECELVAVNRTRAVVRFGDKPKPAEEPRGIFFQPKPEPPAEFGISGEWFVPLKAILLPGSVEPTPGQREFLECAS